MAVVSVAVFNSSCEKENLNDLKQSASAKKPRAISDDEIMKDLPEVKDGRLVFKDSICFADYVQWLFDNQDNAEKIYEVNASIGFVSMHEIYDKGLEILCESKSVTCPYIEEHPTVFHAEEVDGSIIQDMQSLDLVGYIANEYGLFQIGGKIYRSTYDYTYCITNGDESKINTLLGLNAEKTGDSFILSHPTFFKMSQTRADYSYRTAYFPSGKERTVARLRGGYFPDLQSSVYEAETDAQKKVLGVWVGYKLDGVSLSWNNGNYTYYYTGPYAVQYGTDYHTGYMGSSGTYSTGQKITRTFCDVSIGYYKIIVGSNIGTTHRVDYNGQSATVQYTDSFTGAY